LIGMVDRPRVSQEHFFDPSPTETIGASPHNVISHACAEECGDGVCAPERHVAPGLCLRRRHGNDEDTSAFDLPQTNLAVQRDNVARKLVCLDTARSLYTLLQGRNRRRFSCKTGFVHTDESSKRIAIRVTQ
jgi:hypothetical protein